MQKKITDTTAAYGLGMAPGKKLLKVKSGAYSGRMAALVQTSAGTIELYYADAPYTSWSTPIEIATDAVDNAFSAAMATNGDIHIVYTETSTEYLATKKLTFADGTWSVGSKVTIYNSDPAYYPTVAIESGGIVWVSYTRINGALYYVYVKSSEDDGAIWGSGAGDAGTALSSGVISAFSKLVIGPNELYVIYTAAGTDLFFTKRTLSGGSWSSATVISGTGNFDEHFDIAVNSEGILGVVYDNDQMRYREYDGINWGATATIDSDSGTFPQLTFFKNVPVIVYLHEYATGQIELKQTSKQTGTFATPEILDIRSSQFTNVTLYSSGSNTFEDLTTESASDTTADVVHTTTSALVDSIGDSIYLGLSKKFRYVRMLLSTAGVGGAVNFSYWDGAVWKAFVPASGSYHLDSADKELILWSDFDSMPADWQQTAVNEQVKFWVSISVATAFSTAPIGSQITALSNLLALSVRR